MAIVQKSIASRLFRTVFLFYVLISTLVVGVLTTRQYIDTRDRIIHELKIHENKYSDTLAAALWAMDMKELKSIIVHMAERSEIVGIKIIDHNAEEVFATVGMVIDDVDGTESSSMFYWHEFPIDFHHETGTERVGYALLYTSSEVIFELIKFQIFLLVTSILIMILALWLILLYASRNILSKPLSRLTILTKNLELSNLDDYRDINSPVGQNELDILEDSFVSMIQRLRSAKTELAKHQESLEKLVDERTTELKNAITEINIMYTALRESDERMQDIMDYAPAAIYVKDLDGHFIFLNNKVADLHHMQRDEIIGKTLYDILPEDIADEIRKNDMSVIDKGHPVKYEESAPQNDRMHHYLSIKFPLFNESGNIYAVGGISTDITDKKDVDAENVRIQNELQQAQKMESLGLLTGGIAHDFNNLLGIINGFTNLALKKYSNKVDGELIEFIQNVNDAGKRAINLVAQMLTFSRSDESGDVPLKLSLLIKEDVKLIRSTLPTSIEIESEIVPDLPSVLMDPSQLHQILMNLSINARDAMDGMGKLRIKLKWARDLDTESCVSHKSIKGDWVELSVSDTGTGIDPALIQSIFNPFFTTKEVGKGTGMGLSVIYRIMENHGGHILISSEVGEGTTFRMLFPPIYDEKDSFRDIELSPASIPKGNGSEILVVDDEPMLAVHMSELVKGQGYNVTYLTDSIEALTIFKEYPDRFSMLITDQTMPKMTGIELISALREIRPELPVIMCSGYSDKIDANGASDLDISYISKPVDVAKLMLKIAGLLDIKIIQES